MRKVQGTLLVLAAISALLPFEAHGRGFRRSYRRSNWSQPTMAAAPATTTSTTEAATSAATPAVTTAAAELAVDAANAVATAAATTTTDNQVALATATTTVVSYDVSTAQGVANLMARYGRVGHFGGNPGYEGCGCGMTPEAAYAICCYSNSGMATVDVGYAQGADGMWYCCRRYQ